MNILGQNRLLLWSNTLTMLVLEKNCTNMLISYWLYSFKSRSQRLGMNYQIFRSGWPNLVWVAVGHIGGAQCTCLSQRGQHASQRAQGSRPNLENLMLAAQQSFKYTHFYKHYNFTEVPEMFRFHLIMDEKFIQIKSLFVPKTG